MIRAFVGVRIDSAVAKRIAAVHSALRPRIPGVRWITEANYHFTLKFLGAVTEHRIADITDALSGALASFDPFVISARGIGVFPDIRKPRVIWVGLDAKELAPLAAQVEGAMEAIGFAREARSFKAHLTLGRWRSPPKRSADLQNELQPWKQQGFGDSVVNEVVLFESVLRPEGAVYSELEIFHLGKRRGEQR